MKFPLYILSLDPAQLRDWSALCAVKMYISAKKLAPFQGRFEYDLVAMNRKQNLPYDEIVDWSWNTYRLPAFNEGVAQPPVFVLDATGVGVAVRDMMRVKGIPVKPITITLGETITRQGPSIHLGKARLIGKFLGAFDSGKVHVNPSMAIWPQLEHEMLACRAEMSVQGRAKFSAPENEHDDMLFSLALAVWYGEEILRGGRL